MREIKSDKQNLRLSLKGGKAESPWCDVAIAPKGWEGKYRPSRGMNGSGDPVHGILATTLGDIRMKGSGADSEKSTLQPGTVNARL